MSLSAERIAMANCAVEQTFARASIAWQAIPHWDTGDPGQIFVRSDVAVTLAGVAANPAAPPPDEEPFDSTPEEITSEKVTFRITLAQACAATPDALLAAVIPRTVQLARKVDDAVFDTLAKKAESAATANNAPAVVKAWYVKLATTPLRAQGVAPDPNALTPVETAAGILKALVEGRKQVEDSGYLAPSCLVASTAYATDLSMWVGSNVATEGLLVGANANSLFRATSLTGDANANPAVPEKMLMIGRQQEIAHGRAATATPGEEPVDLAVSVTPSLEVIGENKAGEIQLAVRIRYATRFKDERGVVVFHNP
jgi:hypothetical protein